MNLKKPNQCISLEEVRNEIDKIDYKIIQLFSERMKYVEAVVTFKSDEEGIVAAGRKEQVINERAKWAKDQGLDPQTIGKIYTLLIDRNIKHELELLEERQKNNKV